MQRKLQPEEKRLKVELSCVISVALVVHQMARAVVMTSYNNDVIMAVDHVTGQRLWRMNKLEYEGAVIRPNAVVSDGAGHLYMADTGLSYCR